MNCKPQNLNPDFPIEAKIKSGFSGCTQNWTPVFSLERKIPRRIDQLEILCDMDKQIPIRLWILDFPQRSSLFCFALRLELLPLWDICPFTSGLCSWRNVDDVDNFNWTLHSGCTPSNYTGPNCDQGNRNKLTLKLLERLDRCYAEVHYGTVYGFFYWLSRDYVEKWVSGAFH